MSPEPAADEFNLAGASIDGRYDVERLVSVGGFGTVYFGKHRALRSAVAIKVLRLARDLDEDEHRVFTECFLEEARTLGRLRHPAVVKALDFGVSTMPDGRAAPWMALEWVEGRSLREVLLERRGERMPSRAALSLLRPVFEALSEAHAAGIAHRDIKPANIMVTEGHAALPARVLDFGIAKVMRPEESAAPSGETATASVDVAFSARYAAPEQVAAARTGPWTDVHALGLVLTEMLTGRAPYEGNESIELAASALSPYRPTPARFGVDVAAWEPVLARALAFKAAERYQDAAALLAALDAALLERDPSAIAAQTPDATPVAAPIAAPIDTALTLPAARPAFVPPSAPSASPSWRRYAIVGAAAPFALLAVAALSSRRSDPPPTAPAASVRIGDDARAPLRRRCRAPSTLPPLVGLEGITQLAVGGNHSCARLRDGTLRCWGENSDGQLGDGTTEDRASPVLVAGVSDVAEVAAGTLITCARRGDGSVWCWGRGIVPGSGEIQNLRPSPIVGVRDTRQVTAGLMHACALRADGTAWCWGQNDRGQLGAGVVDGSPGVAQVTGLAAVVELTAGEDHTCARLGDGTVWCWGRRDHGELGDGQRARVGLATPTRVAGLPDAEQVAVSDGYGCARVRGGAVWCWGGNRAGQLGDGTDVTRATPAVVPGVTGAVGLVVGASFACARYANGSASCWGGNTFCEMGAAGIETLRLPAHVSAVEGLVTVAAGQSHACGVTAEGATRCWGWNRYGQLGNGVTSDQPDTEAY